MSSFFPRPVYIAAANLLSRRLNKRKTVHLVKLYENISKGFDFFTANAMPTGGGINNGVVVYSTCLSPGVVLAVHVSRSGLKSTASLTDT